MAAVPKFQFAGGPRAPQRICALVPFGSHALTAFAPLTYEPDQSALFAAARIVHDLIALLSVDPEAVSPAANPSGSNVADAEER